jgi:hypothetical protein
MTDPPATVADHDQRGETESPTALDHLRHAVDADQLLDQLGLVLSATLIARRALVPARP